jgi:GAF domain-containing protein
MFDALRKDVRAILDGPGAPEAVLKAVCVRLKKTVPHYDWVGFYLADPAEERTLYLGPYAGAPTDHVRIPFGRGICGRAAETGRTFLVPDVTREGNYLSCSVNVKSEIVVPVFDGEELVGELDIDSHALDAFRGEDRTFLEEIGRLMASRLNALRTG